MVFKLFTAEDYHEVAPLSEVTDEMREKLRSQSQTVFDKIQKCRNHGKATWKGLVNLEEHVETTHKQIDIITNQLVITYCTFKINVPKLLDVPTIYHDLMIKVSQILKLNDLKKTTGFVIQYHVFLNLDVLWVKC